MDRNDLDVANALGRIESKVDTLLERDLDKEVRLRALETRGAWIAGAGAVLGAVGGFLSSVLFGKHS